MTKYDQAKWLFWGYYISIPIIVGLAYAALKIGFEIPVVIGIVAGFTILTHVIIRFVFHCPKCRRPLLQFDSMVRVIIPSKKCHACGTDLTAN